MKATKAGPIIGQALQDFNYIDGDVGLVVAFVKTAYFTGESLREEVSGMYLESTLLENNADGVINDLMRSKNVLSYLMENPIDVAKQDISEIWTDAVIAGVELITPAIYTQSLSVDSIKSSSGTGISFDLNGEKLSIFGTDPTIMGSMPSEVITFDASGNATFMGSVTADSVIANKIIGLEVFTDKVSALSQTVDGLLVESAAVIADSTTVSLGLSDAVSSLEERLRVVEELVAQSSSTNSFENLDSLGLSGDLNVIGSTILNGGLLVNEIGAIDDLLSFVTDVEFSGKVYFTSDTAGLAVIKAGQDKVVVNYASDYLDAPIVNISPELDAEMLKEDIRFAITDKTNKGFSIILNTKFNRDIVFNRTAIAVKNPKTFYSEEDKSANEVENDSELVSELSEQPQDLLEDVVTEGILESSASHNSVLVETP